MSRYANVSAVPLSIAVFLATDNYDYSSDPNTISATSLIKPLRQIILGGRIPVDDAAVDLASMMPSRVGSAIHDAIERSWLNNYKEAFKALGYPQRVIDKIRINPTEVPDGIIPVYLERRAHRQIGKWVISGKFDFVGEGRVEDFKTTSTYTAMNKTNDEKYILQGSIYRWLNPKLITQDKMAIQFIFTDWSGAKAKADPAYPQQRFQEHILPLLPLAETENFIKNKLALHEKYHDAKEPDLPLCEDADLWRSDPVFKYYKNPENATKPNSRSTKNFATVQEANLRRIEDGSVGVVKEVPGQVMACKYCPGFSLCSQKDALIASGDLVL
jgi:hypothetical protein